jgi:transposase-like protein
VYKVPALAGASTTSLSVEGSGTPHETNGEGAGKIAESIRVGAYAEQAARAAGISPSTFYDWMRRGEAGEEPFSEFSETVRAREAEAEVAAVTMIRQAADEGDWRAAAYVERKHPDRWARRPPPPVQPKEGHRTPEQLDEEVEQLLAALEEKPRADARLRARLGQDVPPEAMASGVRRVAQD